MGHKVDMTEVNDFSDKLSDSRADISQGISTVQSRIDNILNMESFSGNMAHSTKKYLNDFHHMLLELFDTLFIFLDEKSDKHVEQFYSIVDTSEKAIVQTDYVEETKLMEIEIPYKNFKGYNDGVVKTIDSVSDIVSVAKPNFYSVMGDYLDVTETMEDLIKNLDTFTGKGKGHDNTAKDIIDTIETALNKAQAVDDELRITNFKYGSADKGKMEIKGFVAYLGTMNSVLTTAHDSLQENTKYNPKGKHAKVPSEPHISKKSKVDKFKYVAKETGRGAVNGGTGNVGVEKSRGGKFGLARGAGKALGPASAGLSYYSNYHDAVAKGLEGKDAHIRAAEDTAVETVISGAVQAGTTAIFTAAIPVPGVGTAVGVVVGMTLNSLLNVKVGKSKKSVMDRAKSGFQKIKGWFS